MLVYYTVAVNGEVLLLKNDTILDFLLCFDIFSSERLHNISFI